MPFRASQAIRTLFNQNKTLVDVSRDIELNRMRAVIEDDTVTMLSLLVTEADKKKLPIELNHESMLKFLDKFEQMRDREMRLIGEGYPEKHARTGSKMYARLIKIFTDRSEATEEFKRRKNQFLEGLKNEDMIIA